MPRELTLTGRKGWNICLEFTSPLISVHVFKELIFIKSSEYFKGERITKYYCYKFRRTFFKDLSVTEYRKREEACWDVQLCSLRNKRCGGVHEMRTGGGETGLEGKMISILGVLRLRHHAWRDSCRPLNKLSQLEKGWEHIFGSG